MSTTADASPSDVPPKSTLHCPHCEHESRYDADWLVVETARRVRVLCPQCGTTVAARPRAGADGPPRTPGEAWREVWRQWGDGLRLYQGLWRPTERA